MFLLVRHRSPQAAGADLAVSIGNVKFLESDLDPAGDALPGRVGLERVERERRTEDVRHIKSCVLRRDPDLPTAWVPSIVPVMPEPPG